MYLLLMVRFPVELEVGRFEPEGIEKKGEGTVQFRSEKETLRGKGRSSLIQPIAERRIKADPKSR